MGQNARAEITGTRFVGGRAGAAGQHACCPSRSERPGMRGLQCCEHTLGFRVEKSLSANATRRILVRSEY